MESTKGTEDWRQNDEQKPGRMFAGSHRRGKRQAVVHEVDFVADSPDAGGTGNPLEFCLSQVWQTRGRRLRYETLPLAKQL